MKNKKKKIIILVIILVLVIAAITGYFFLTKKTSSKVVDDISSFGYTLDNRDTDYMKEKFNLLKEELNKDDINYENYAKLLAELFVIDLYTIDNKNGSYDVGSLEYIYPDDRADFEIHARNTLYQYVTGKSDRQDEMPEVTNTEVTNIEKDTFTFNDEELESYSININWDYKKDLGYDKKAIIKIFRKDNRLYVGEISNEIASEEQEVEND